LFFIIPQYYDKINGMGTHHYDKSDGGIVIINE